MEDGVNRPLCHDLSTMEVYRKWVQFAAADPCVEGMGLIDGDHSSTWLRHGKWLWSRVVCGS